MGTALIICKGDSDYQHIQQLSSGTERFEHPQMHLLSSLVFLLAAISPKNMIVTSRSGMVSAFSHHTVKRLNHHIHNLGNHGRNVRPVLLSSCSDVEWTTDKVRSTFVSFFEKNDHVNVKSSPCVPLNDPTLLFANAGMNQFKPIFLGQVDPTSPMASLKRAANSQKCIRAGGKHNDLEDVGKDTYHHTFFEMLGTWSFGDYFKKEAIEYAWELLTNVYGIDKDRLYATYFKGDEAMGLEPDWDAKNFWLQYLPESHVIGSGAKDNFWEMGDTGPCGPCTEIHYDRIGNRDAAHLVNADDPDVIEIWNIVFIQFNRDEKGLSTLPNKHIDTGMGLERLVSLLQKKRSNYDIDTFQAIFKEIEKLSNVGSYTGLVGAADITLKDTAYRAVADHARTLCFSLADGAVPNNEGRGYVLRRILRRAARYGQQILKAEAGFFAKLVPVVVETFGSTFPELVKSKEHIIDVIQEEERAFSTMLSRGISYFSDLKDEMKTKGSNIVQGDKAFFLYDTLGFPIDLTEQMATEAGFSVDVSGFENEMNIQKQRSRDARNLAKSGGAAKLELIAEQTSWLANAGIMATDDSYKYEWDLQLASTIHAIFGENGFIGNGASAPKGSRVGLILDKSSFYAEAGGQESDSGTISIVSGDAGVGIFSVIDVQSYGGYLLHIGIVEEGSIHVGQSVSCQVDYDRRRKVAPNHSMTHVLNAALRKVLGDGVDQRGSSCNSERLRFDFSHRNAMTLDELKLVESWCQNVVKDGRTVSSKVLPLSEAQKIEGVRAVFGEVYPDPVRVVAVGSDTSIEFCGGTHISNTAEAAAFTIIEESAVAKGIRRITALTQDSANEAINEGQKFEILVTNLESINPRTEDLDKMAGSLRKDIDGSVMSVVLKAELRARVEKVQKKAADEKKRILAGRIDNCLNVVRQQVQASTSTGRRSLVLNVDICADSKASQKVINVIRELAPASAFMGVSEENPGSGGKAIVFAIVPDGLGFRADEWVSTTIGSFGGRGGGKPDNAQGQISSCSDINAVIAVAESFAKERDAIGTT